MLLWLALQTVPDVDAAMTRYRAQTKAAIECSAGKPDDIVICDRRAADRFRLPLIDIDLSDPKNEPVAVASDRLLARTSNCQEMSIFLVGCGKAGVGVSTATGLRGLGERPIAP